MTTAIAKCDKCKLSFERENFEEVLLCDIPEGQKLAYRCDACGKDLEIFYPAAELVSAMEKVPE